MSEVFLAGMYCSTCGVMKYLPAGRPQGRESSSARARRRSSRPYVPPAPQRNTTCTGKFSFYALNVV